MTSQPEAIEALRYKVETFLRQKKLGYQVRPDGRLLVRQGSTALIVSVVMPGEQPLVKLAAAVTLNATNITPELTRLLLEKNAQLLFGKFSLTKDNSIWFEHTLLGESLDADQLHATMAVIALTADSHDEKISQMAGGKRAADL